MRRFRLLPLALVCAIGLGGCAGLSPTEQRTLTGGAAGTAGGALIGALAGNAGLGALIGGGVGAAGGYLFDQSKQSQERAFQQGYRQGRATRSY